MKTSLKLVLLYFAFQIAGVVCGAFLGIIYVFITTGLIDVEAAQSSSLAISLFLGMVFMGVYLWRAGYIRKDKITWSIVSPGYLLLTLVFYAGLMLLLDTLMSHMEWLPNIMESSFSELESNWLGILSICLFGPILEELLFRGAITRVLLKSYEPVKAVVFSALIFGIFHINPVQVVSATLIGLVLGWIYYKTASLIPCILIHIVNNSLSVWLTIRYPDINYMKDLLPDSQFIIVLVAALIICMAAFFLMNKKTINYPWRETAGNIENT